MSKRGMKLITKLISWSASACTLRITSLNHKLIDYTMKLKPIVKSCTSKGHKVGYGIGSLIDIQSQTNWSLSGVDGSVMHIG